MTAEVIELNQPLTNIPTHIRSLMYMEEEMENLRKIVIQQDKNIQFLEAKLRVYEGKSDVV